MGDIGGIAVIGKVAVKHWGRTQATRALSSGEAEDAALVIGCAEGLGIQGLMKDLGVDWKVRIWSDSSAARAIVGRRGLGKMRHVELRLLWVQDVAKSGVIELVKIRGDGNLADHLTKPKTRKEMKEILDMVGQS